MSNINIKGLSELQRFLDALPAKIETNIIRGALRAGAREIMNEARLNAPIGEPSESGIKKYNLYPGALRDSIRLSVRLDRRNNQVVASVKAGGKVKKTGANVYYAHMVEFGTRHHSLRKGGDATHPGVSPRPFMRPALDAKAGQSVVAAGEYIKKRLASKHGLNTVDIDIAVDL